MLLTWPTVFLFSGFLALAIYDTPLALLMLEGTLGAIVLLAAVLLTVVDLSFGGWRAWRSWGACLGLAVSLFLARSLVSLS